MSLCMDMTFRSGRAISIMLDLPLVVLEDESSIKKYNFKFTHVFMYGHDIPFWESYFNLLDILYRLDLPSQTTHLLDASSTHKFSKLTKKGWAALADCQSATLPSPCAAPNLLPCAVKRTRLTLAKTPAGRTLCTDCGWDHSHIFIEPSWHPETSR